MPAKKHSRRKVLLEMTEYEYKLLKSWLAQAYPEYFEGNSPNDTGFSNSEAFHLDYLITRIFQDHRAWTKVIPS
jgi:hypothetical protein